MSSWNAARRLSGTNSRGDLVTGATGAVVTSVIQNRLDDMGDDLPCLLMRYIEDHAVANWVGTR